MSTFEWSTVGWGIQTREEAKIKYFIRPFMVYLVAILLGPDSGTQTTRLQVEDTMSGQAISVNSQYKFIIEREFTKFCIVEVKKDGINQGMAQDLLAVADIESMNRVYIATNYLNWAFFRGLDDRIENEWVTLDMEGEGVIIAPKRG